MWARVVEIMLGFWLMASPFIFADGSGVLNDLILGLLVLIFGFLSFWRRTGWAHFLSLAAALWLIVFGYSAGHPAPPDSQNRIIVGLLLAMFAIIPNDIDELPRAWQRFYEEDQTQR